MRGILVLSHLRCPKAYSDLAGQDSMKKSPGTMSRDLVPFRVV
jgi:hypothetical protein